MNDIAGGHTIKGFDQDLMNLHSMVMEMGGIVENQLARAIRALDDEDPGGAREVIARDRLVNDMDVRIDEELVTTIARRQPVARDLRNLMTMNKTVSDLERIGDEARKLAALVEEIYGSPAASPPNSGLVHDVRGIALYGKSMLDNVLNAFNTMDVEKAVAVIRQDERIEEKFRAALRRLATYILEDSRTVGYSIDAVLALRALERIGGHAKNISGYVIYLATGRDVRHVDLNTIVDEVLKDLR